MSTPKEYTLLNGYTRPLESAIACSGSMYLDLSFVHVNKFSPLTNTLKFFTFILLIHSVGKE